MSFRKSRKHVKPHFTKKEEMFDFTPDKRKLKLIPVDKEITDKIENARPYMNIEMKDWKYVDAEESHGLSIFERCNICVSGEREGDSTKKIIYMNPDWIKKDLNIRWLPGINEKLMAFFLLHEAGHRQGNNGKGTRDELEATFYALDNLKNVSILERKQVTWLWYYHFGWYNILSSDRKNFDKFDDLIKPLSDKGKYHSYIFQKQLQYFKDDHDKELIKKVEKNI